MYVLNRIQWVMSLFSAMCIFAVFYYISFTSSPLVKESPHVEVRELPWTFISNTSAHAWERMECSLNGTRNVGYSDARKSQGKSDLVDKVLADRECRPAMASRLEVDHLPDELTICDLPEWWVSVERPLTGSGGDVRLMHNGAERTINVGALYYFGMSWPLNLDIDGVLGKNLD